MGCSIVKDALRKKKLLQLPLPVYYSASQSVSRRCGEFNMLPMYKSPKRRIPGGGDGTQAASDRLKFLADCLLRGLMPTRRCRMRVSPTWRPYRGLEYSLKYGHILAITKVRSRFGRCFSALEANGT
jgi:hypothetical protein